MHVKSEIISVNIVKCFVKLPMLLKLFELFDSSGLKDFIINLDFLLVFKSTIPFCLVICAHNNSLRNVDYYEYFISMAGIIQPLEFIIVCDKQKYLTDTWWYS